MSVFKNQTKLRLNCDTNLSTADHAALTAQIIKWEKPSGATGSFTATAGTAPYIYYDIVSTADLNEIGDWAIWSYCTFAGGLVAPGKTAIMSVLEEGALA